MTSNKFGKYEILGKLGQGAMGEVYRALDVSLNRELAVKTINREMSADETLRKRFLREAQSAARLSHPNIITVYDFGQEADRLFMAMELLQGSDLKHVIQQRELRTLDAKLAIMEQIAEGLGFAHGHGVVHRDLKPANIHIQPGGQVKIVDFGLAHVSGSDMTRTGMVMGTPHYMSPEQVRGEKVDARSDVFSVGCIYYEMLTGQRPFDADSMHAVLFKVLQEEPRPIRELAPELPAVLIQLVERTLSKDPSVRYADGRELVAALRRARQAIQAGRGHVALSEIGPPPASARPRAAGGPPRAPGSASVVSSASQVRAKSLPVLPIAAGVALLLAAGALGTWLLRPVSGRPTPAPSGPARSDPFAEAVADTQIELARKKLEAGDYREAERHAQRAVNLAPQSEEAKQLLRDAQAIVSRVERAAAQIKAGGSEAEVRSALWELMQVDPNHRLVADQVPGYEGRFADQAARARARVQQAREAGEKAGARQLDEFKAGLELAKDAEAALKAGQQASAARLFCAAASKLERAQRSVAH